MDDIVCLQQFEAMIPASNPPVKTLGFVFSSPALLGNIKTALRDMTQGLSLALDGTYKLLYNGWVLCILATHTVNYTASAADKSESHSSIPLLFCLVRTEGQPAYDALLQSLKLVSIALV